MFTEYADYFEYIKEGITIKTFVVINPNDNYKYVKCVFVEEETVTDEYKHFEFETLTKTERKNTLVLVTRHLFQYLKFIERNLQSDAPFNDFILLTAEYWEK